MSIDQSNIEKKNEEAIETLGKQLIQWSRNSSTELSFTLISDDRDDTVLSVSTKRSKREKARQVRLKLDFKEDNNAAAVESDLLELSEASKHLLENRLVPCLKKHIVSCKGGILQFAFIDDRLPDFINMVSNCFVEQEVRLKKVVFESCGSNQATAEEGNTVSIFDENALRQLCSLSDEVHLDYEDRELNDPQDLSSFLSVLSQVTSLKVIGLSYTFCDDISSLVKILEANKASLQEFVLYNAFSGVTKSALRPLVESMTKHATLKKFTLLHSRLNSSIYRWAITSIVEGNKSIIGLCTDGNYSQNATWLGRFLGSNEQLTEVNLSHPNFEDDGHARASSPGATLSLVQGIGRNTVLRSVKLVGIALSEPETAQAVRTLIETNETIEKFACGNNFLSSTNFALIIGGTLSNATMRKLSIQSVDLDPVGAQTVFDVLSHNTTLHSLSLGAHRRRYSFRARRNAPVQQVDPSLQVATLIAGGLQLNTSLQYLSIPTNLNNSECMDYFTQVLENDNMTLERLTFWPKVPCPFQKIDYLTSLNRCKRGEIFADDSKNDVPLGLWAHIFASRPNPDLVRYFCSQMPNLFDGSSTQRLSPAQKRGPPAVSIENGAYAKRVKNA
jgi:hypothetical protein